MDRKERSAFGTERKQYILDTLRSARRVEASEIAEALDVTTETIRKDLIQLERSGLLRRVHGGAVPVDQLVYEPAVSARTELTAEKTRIARAARAYLPDHGSVLIDAGSTTTHLVNAIPSDLHLSVYTNTLPIALSLTRLPRVNVFTLGGRLRSRTMAEVGDFALRALADINVDVAFLGTNGLSHERGLTTPDAEEATIKRQMLATAKRRVLLADHSKIGATREHKHADLADIDLLITDKGITEQQRLELERAGLQIQVV